jgi:hypothetical protein
MDPLSNVNENIDPTTSPSTLNKPFSPSTPTSIQRSTPLHRRFLQKVAMSPATRPHSPMREKSNTTAKGRESPTKGRDSPTKQQLEVGQNGFYFTCELPMSKVTPKKIGTPDTATPRSRTSSPIKEMSSKKGVPSRRASPTRQTPSKARPTSPLKNISTPTDRKPVSPLKNTPKSTIGRSPEKSTPAKVFSTPFQKTATPDPTKRAQGIKVSPTKSIKLASKFTQKCSSTPTPILRIPPECLKDVTKKEVADAVRNAPAISGSTNLTSSTTYEHAIEAHRVKPTREKSFNIGDLMVGLKEYTSKPRDAEEFARGEANMSGPPTPLRRAAEKLQLATVVTIPHESYSKRPNVLEEPQPPESAHEVVASNQVALPIRTRQLPLQCSPLPFTSSGSETEQEEVISPSKTQTKRQVSHQEKSNVPRPTPMRAGTDLVIIHAMQENMDKMQQSLRSSFGPTLAQHDTANSNSYEFPAMSSTGLDSTRDTPITSRPKRTLIQTASDTSACSSASSVRASMLMKPKHHSGAVTPSATRKPHRPHVGQTPTQARMELLATLKEPHTTEWLEETRGGTVSSALVVPTVTPKKTKPFRGGIPRSARQSVFDSPAPSKAPSTPKVPTTSRKSLYTTPHPTNTHHLAQDKTSNPPYDPKLDPRPCEQKFASAIDIADRVAEWNSEDRKKAVAASPRTRMKEKTPKRVKFTGKESHTPTGSPTRCTSPGKLSSPVKPPQPHSQPTPRTAKLKTPTAPPKTPFPKKTLASRLHTSHPRTPENTRLPILDRNALRTPSKAIVTSLDAAIDRKIEEDARSGREFTPSGNRVRDLLEANKGGGSGLGR